MAVVENHEATAARGQAGVTPKPATEADRAKQGAAKRKKGGTEERKGYDRMRLECTDENPHYIYVLSRNSSNGKDASGR